jgi:hypothetical protein
VTKKEALSRLCLSPGSPPLSQQPSPALPVAHLKRNGGPRCRVSSQYQPAPRVRPRQTLRTLPLTENKVIGPVPGAFPMLHLSYRYAVRSPMWWARTRCLKGQGTWVMLLHRRTSGPLGGTWVSCCRRWGDRGRWKMSYLHSTTPTHDRIVCEHLGGIVYLRVIHTIRPSCNISHILARIPM